MQKYPLFAQNEVLPTKLKVLHGSAERPNYKNLNISFCKKLQSDFQKVKVKLVQKKLIIFSQISEFRLCQDFEF